MQVLLPTTWPSFENIHLLKNISYPDEMQTKTPKESHQLLLNHLRPMNFESTECAKFHKLVRRSVEGMRDFVLRVQNQVATCNFGAELQTQLRDWLVAGVNDIDVQKQLLREPRLTYQFTKDVLENWMDMDAAVNQTT